MPSEPTDFAPLRFSTDALPPRERVPFWREWFARKIVRVDLEPLSDEQFEATATLRAWPGLRSISWVSSPAHIARPRAVIADGDDTVAVLINLSGATTASGRGREVSLGAGDATVIVHAEAASMTHSHRQTTECVVVPRDALAPLVPHVEDAALRLIAHGNEPLRLLTSYIKAVGEDLVLAPPELRHLVVTHVHDLVAMVIGTTRDGAAVAGERGVRAARLAAVKADIIEHLGRDLTLVAVAARQRVTPRYVQLLFETVGTTFSEFVLERRLARAYRMLCDPRYAAATIITIAFAAGFGDISYFNRAFRRRYGATPSDARTEAQRAEAAALGNGK
jgi:AraC-like DNA-binding protein